MEPWGITIDANMLEIEGELLSGNEKLIFKNKAVPVDQKKGCFNK